MLTISLALDPQTLRVTAQAREFADGDFPPGLRGLGWAIRSTEVDEEEWSRFLSGAMTPDEQDDFSRSLWSLAGPTDWPDSSPS